MLVAVASQNATNSTGNFADTTLSASEIAAIRTHLEDRIPAGLQVDIMPAEVVSFRSLPISRQFPALTLLSWRPVSNALAAYLDPNTWDWTKSVVRVNEVISLIDSIVGGITSNPSRLLATLRSSRLVPTTSL